VDVAAFKRTYTFSKSDFAGMMTTVLLVLFAGVEIGIVAGVALSLALFLWRTAKPHVAIVGQVAGTEHFRNIKRHSVITDPRLLSIRIDESLYFANAKFLEDTIYAEIAGKPELRHVILMCPAVNWIDASALESLETIAHRLESAGIGFHMSEVKGPVMDALQRSDFFSHFKGTVFLSQFDAVKQLLNSDAPSAGASLRVLPVA
jgi:SulP family sulfate permease